VSEPFNCTVTQVRGAIWSTVPFHIAAANLATNPDLSIPRPCRERGNAAQDVTPAVLAIMVAHGHCRQAIASTLYHMGTKHFP
jgi:hypothetical protein